MEQEKCLRLTWFFDYPWPHYYGHFSIWFSFMKPKYLVQSMDHSNTQSQSINPIQSVGFNSSFLRFLIVSYETQPLWHYSTPLQVIWPYVSTRLFLRNYINYILFYKKWMNTFKISLLIHYYNFKRQFIIYYNNAIHLVDFYKYAFSKMFWLKWP